MQRTNFYGYIPKPWLLDSLFNKMKIKESISSQFALSLSINVLSEY